MKKYVIYKRVSTTRQGASGLGLEAQESICRDYIVRNGGEVLNVFCDVESGKSRTRKALFDAIEECKKYKATLIIAKLDRLARDVEFTFKIVNTGIEIVFCDMPMVNTMILGVFASVAQYERELISQRTKSALKAKKERGETWERNSNNSKAVEVSRENRRNKAIDNANNVFLRNYLKTKKIQYNKSTDNSEWESLCNELNLIGAKTSTGLEFNLNRLKSMVNKINNLYN